jgi:hypothetical protein
MQTIPLKRGDQIVRQPNDIQVQRIGRKRRGGNLAQRVRIPAMPITIPRRWRSRFRVMPITVGAKRRWAVLIMLK